MRYQSEMSGKLSFDGRPSVCSFFPSSFSEQKSESFLSLAVSSVLTPVH